MAFKFDDNSIRSGNVQKINDLQDREFNFEFTCRSVSDGRALRKS